MADQQWVLVHKKSGQEFVFSSRAEYINTKAQGGYREKPAGEAPARVPAGEQPRRRPTPQPETPSREPVNDDPTVENPAAGT